MGRTPCWNSTHKEGMIVDQPQPHEQDETYEDVEGSHDTYGEVENQRDTYTELGG
jgi:hypothetical protein